MSEPAGLPIIDLGPARQGVYATTGALISHAFTTSGFCYIRNHGVPDAVIDRLRAQALDFFHAPMEEKLTCKPKEAVRGFTSDAAWAGHDEAQVGRLQAGLRADFVVFDRDPLTVDAAQLDDLKVLSTWVDGEPVYTAEAAPAG